MNQRGLSGVLRFQGFEDGLVQRAGGGEMGDGDRFGLPLSIRPGVGLLYNSKLQVSENHTSRCPPACRFSP